MIRSLCVVNRFQYRFLSSTIEPPNLFKPRSQFVNESYVSPWGDHFNGQKLIEALYRKLTWDSTKVALPSDNVPELKNCNIKSSKFDTRKAHSTKRDHVTWIGHSTCLIQTAGIRIITDPVWGDRVSPVSFIGPKRVVDTSVEVEDLSIDLVLLSHSHYDHLDLGTVQRIGNRALWVVPLGLKKLLASVEVSNCIEMDWWETRTFAVTRSETSTNGSIALSQIVDNKTIRKLRESESVSIEVTCLPARHWSNRTPFDVNKTLWASFAVKSSMGNYYFAGDTGYCNRLFKSIGATHGPFDLSLIPIGAYKPRRYHEEAHCDPAQSILMHNDLLSKRSLAIHWGTYNLADDTGCEPAFELSRVRAIAGLAEDRFFTMLPGDTLHVDEPAPNDISMVYPNETKLYSNLINAMTGIDKSTLPTGDLAS